MSAITHEQIERARSVNLLTYLQTNEPNNIKQIGARAYRLIDHDSLKITDSGKWYWFSRNIGSTNALDYLVEVRGMGFVDAVETLAGQALLSHKSRIPEPKSNTCNFMLPLRNRDNIRVIAYLQSRGIDKQIINYCISNGNLYESSISHNCVFVGRSTDGKARFASMRGTMGNFRQDISGSDKRFGFSLTTKATGDITVAVFESAIDALSMATLDKMEVRLGVTHYLSLSGTSPLAIQQFLKDHPQTSKVVLCLDNDDPGKNAMEKISGDLCSSGIEVFTYPPVECKDWNDALIKAKYENTPRHNNVSHSI